MTWDQLLVFGWQSGTKEIELLRMSWKEMGRMFEGYSNKVREQRELTRRIAYEIWRKSTKNPPDIDSYWNLDGVEVHEMTEQQLDEIWNKHGKLNG